MFKKDKKGFYYFEELRKFLNLIHGFSTREFGDGRKEQIKFLNVLRLAKENLVMMEQVHGNKIKVVNQTDKGRTVKGVDGLITDQAGIVLAVKSADCPNLLFYEPESKIIGVCHAGWRGILKKLPQKMIDLLILKGALPENLLVAIGPHIKKCCYEVKKDVSDRFPVCYLSKQHLDLTRIVIDQLIHSGIKADHIFDSVCNSCKINDFFSYRKDNKQTYGEILSTISLKAEK